MPTGTIRGRYESQTVQIDTDLTGKEGYAVAFDGTDENVVNLTAVASAPMYVLVDGGDVAGSASAPVNGAIANTGEAIVKIGGNVTQGQYLMPTTNGVWITATDGNYYGCQAQENGVSGDEIRARIQSGYLETT